MKDKDVYILGIESSCDETAASIVKNGRESLSNIIYSQIEIHQPYGGVVPEVASRNHIKKIDIIVDKALEESGLTLNDMDAVAVTYGPGLIGSLLVGLSFAKALSYSVDIPLLGINHIEGHICANYINNYHVMPPFITLVASGGHTNIVVVKDYGVYEVLGQTRDDAAGEAFDKISRSLDLGYPGGPAIDKAASKGDSSFINFPRSYLEEDCFDFSFSGLKSAVLNYLNTCKMKEIPIETNNIAASFQAAVIDVLASKVIKAALDTQISTICLSGGVARNSLLRSTLGTMTSDLGLKLHFPEPDLCSDNAAMIASAGYFKFIKEEYSHFDLNAIANLKVKEPVDNI
ncbi:tRNA (adenosine(37)-N6)-threonylcarbamoyltransferase complex transferase subunit TsaD [Alkalibaculum sp. M08DMB]|uniref:tRNA N6-adenosine threonylcarbamoyltransferase n=1 Tax=Alkalibaculum sporogenes TaxID=2655001 RepID=A0A6A7K6P7_9FIRM|nr:tRNA (adenosine(37)-N6)-threonylcarbamoyltransferase complex transferase subunit TsaD [Alkalibaculum sporogenes]MPW24887.1 tRNA (adenosine(37)-N6)-threonylcarbamoyltransferase complex transferase subunit TsaD [Alkalibaculum sporogenes]